MEERKHMSYRYTLTVGGFEQTPSELPVSVKFPVRKGVWKRNTPAGRGKRREMYYSYANIE